MDNPKYRYRRYNSCAAGKVPNTLNDLESSPQMGREPTYDDSSRITNQLFWLSDYSHPERDIRPDLNEDVVTPIRPTINRYGMKYMSGMHKMSRYACERSG